MGCGPQTTNKKMIQDAQNFERGQKKLSTPVTKGKMSSTHLQTGEGLLDVRNEGVSLSRHESFHSLKVDSVLKREENGRHRQSEHLSGDLKDRMYT